MLQDLIAGFDQEAAAVVMARLVSFKMETEVISNLYDLLFYKSRVLNLKFEIMMSYFILNC